MRNATVLGAVANVVAIEFASPEGVEVRLFDRLRIELPVQLHPLLIAALLDGVLP